MKLAFLIDELAFARQEFRVGATFPESRPCQLGFPLLGTELAFFDIPFC